MSEKIHSHRPRNSTPDTSRRDRSPYGRSRHSDLRNGRDRSRSPRRRKDDDALTTASKRHGDRHNSRERRRNQSTDKDSGRRKNKDKERERDMRSQSVDTIHQSRSISPDGGPERGRQSRRSPSTSSSLDSRSSSHHRSKSRRHRRHRSRSADEHYHRSKHSSSSRHKDKHRSSRKKHRDEEKDERRSVLTGKKIKLKVRKDAADHERDANRESLLQFLNSAYE